MAAGAGEGRLRVLGAAPAGRAGLDALRWNEVKPGLDPAQFTMDVVQQRIARYGDLFEGVLTTRQRLSDALKALS